MYSCHKGFVFLCFLKVSVDRCNKILESNFVNTFSSPQRGFKLKKICNQIYCNSKMTMLIILSFKCCYN